MNDILKIEMLNSENILNKQLQFFNCSKKDLIIQYMHEFCAFIELCSKREQTKLNMILITFNVF